jgi:hypothetical protein
MSVTANSEGYAAYLDGMTLEHNPHPYGSDSWNDWNEGFDNAKRDEE